MAKLRWLTGDSRTLEHSEWSRWLKSAAFLTNRFDHEFEDDPFAYNETASVSILAAAAVRAGYLALAEYVATKGQPKDRRLAAEGRCDLWLDSPDRDWAFEFKQICRERPPTLKALERTMERAQTCARCVRHDEASERVAGLIVSLYFVEDEDLPVATRNLEAFASQVDYAAWIEPSGEAAAATYFFFNLV